MKGGYRCKDKGNGRGAVTLTTHKAEMKVD